MTRESSKEPTPPTEHMERLLAADLKNLRNRLTINLRRLEYGVPPPVKLDHAANTEKRLTRYCKHQCKLLGELHDDLKAHYIALKKMTENNNIELLEKKTDIPNYPQIPSRKPKSPWDDAHVLRRSIQIAKEMDKEEDTDQDDDEDPKPLRSKLKREQDTHNISGDEKSSSKKPRQLQQETGSKEREQQSVRTSVPT
jgi:hypothetical protein